MKTLLAATLLLAFLFGWASASVDIESSSYYSGGAILSTVELAKPVVSGGYNLSELLSIRGGEVRITPQRISTDKIGQIFKAGYGITDANTKKRTVSSFDDAYSLLLYLVTDEGVYVYIPNDHTLAKVVDIDLRDKLAAAAARDRTVFISKANIVVAGSPKRAGHRRPRDGRRFMHIEAGKVVQNMELEAINQGLGFIAGGNLTENRISFMLKMPTGFEPICILTVGELGDITPAATAQTVTQPQPAAEKDEDKPAVVQKKQPNVLVFISETNFPEQAYTEITELLQLAGADVATASTTVNRVRGDLRGQLTPDIVISEALATDYDAVIIVGSTLSRSALKKDEHVFNFVSRAYDRGSVVASYGRGVEVLARSGVLIGKKKVTGDAGQRRTVSQNGGEYVEQAVVVDRRIVTAKEQRSAELSSITAGATGTAGLVKEIMNLLNEKDN